MSSKNKVLRFGPLIRNMSSILPKTAVTAISLEKTAELESQLVLQAQLIKAAKSKGLSKVELEPLVKKLLELKVLLSDSQSSASHAKKFMRNNLEQLLLKRYLFL